MTYAEILAAVISETNKPALTAEIANAIQRSTLKMHGLEFWKFDLVLVSLAIAVPAFLMTINTSSSLTRFRQTCFIKAHDPLNTDPLGISYSGSNLPYYDPADPNRLVDAYGRSLNNVYYMTGRTINIRSSVAPSAIYMGYYQRPVITPVGSYSSWIADEYPFAIIDDATAQIFQMIGMDDKKQLYQARVAEHIQILKINYLEDQSR